MLKLSYLILSSLLLSKNKFGFGNNFVQINVRYCETENFENRGNLIFLQYLSNHKPLRSGSILYEDQLTRFVKDIITK